MLIVLIGFFTNFLCAQVSNEKVEIDYVKANINIKQYDRIPQGELLFLKYQAIEPAFFYEGPLKGHGYREPEFNDFILNIRNAGINVYVDYVTPAKSVFYRTNNNYELCSSETSPFKEYIKLIPNIFKKTKSDSYFFKSLPLRLKPLLGIIYANKDKKDDVVKHFFKGTQIINIKSLLDDTKLYTIQIISKASGIDRYIYDTFDPPWTIKPIYKQRVYEFVASNSYQIAMMLKGKRMDWVEIDDYFIKKLGYEKVMDPYNYSHIHPNLLDKDNIDVGYITCTGKDLNKLKKVMTIINKRIKKLRTNYEFYSKVLQNFAKDTQTPYIDPEKHPFYSNTFLRKKEVDAGYFDFSYEDQ